MSLDILLVGRLHISLLNRNLFCALVCSNLGVQPSTNRNELRSGAHSSIRLCAKQRSRSMVA